MVTRRSASNVYCELAHGFSRMLRHYLEMDGLGEREGSLAAFRRKIQVFLSHSKHDPHGEPVADAMRDWLHQHSELASFMDVRDIPAGLSFGDGVRLHALSEWLRENQA